MANEIMLSLGDYRFAITTAAYQELRRTSEYRWAPMHRIAHRVSLQYVGQSTEEIHLRGTIYPQYKGGLAQLDAMREEAGKGQPLMLVTGLGQNLGPWCILEVGEEQAIFAQQGVPRKIEFSIRLQYFGPDAEQPGASAEVSTFPPSVASIAPFLATPPPLQPMPADLSQNPPGITPVQLSSAFPPPPAA